MSKLVVVKAIQSHLININQVLRTDIEASNRGILALSSTGVLTLVAWIKKRSLIKHIEDVSDALWQKGGNSELIAACYSGALLRFSCQQDTGLTKTLQLSAKTLLSMISTKDSSIKSLKSLRIWGHTQSYILLQPQPDRLVLMSTNSASRPAIIGIIKTPNVQSAHIAGSIIIVQPCTGSDIYIHDALTCKTIEVVSLVVSRPGVSYIQWDFLTCSFSASRIALTDSERRLYIACFNKKKYHCKKNGIKTYHLTPRQVVWPSAFQPLSLNRFILSLSDSILSVFCSSFRGEREEFYYFTYDAVDGGSLTLKYKFTKQVSLLPGLCHELPDLFLTEEGLCMLSDKDCQAQNVTSKPDFQSLLASLEEALQAGDMERISRIKADVEEDLGIFLSSCNHLDGWVKMVETRSRQHAQLVHILLSYLTKRASAPDRGPNLIGLKELAKHHFKTLQDEMSNVLKYVDAEKVSQQLLVMVEQMKFYLKSVEAMKIPEGTPEDKEMLRKFEIWGDRPVKEILHKALVSGCVKMGERYLAMKPWIYGQIETAAVVSTCVEIARTVTNTNLLFNMEKNYKEELKLKLFSSKEMLELTLLQDVLSSWKALSPKEALSLFFIKYVHQLSPPLVTKPPLFWSELVHHADPDLPAQERELSVGAVLQWSKRALHLVLLDLFVRVHDSKIMSDMDVPALWQYLLIRRDETHLLKWLAHSLCGSAKLKELEEVFKRSASPAFKEKEIEVQEKSVENAGTPKVAQRKASAASRTGRGDCLLGRQLYNSDSDSFYSLESSVFETIDQSVKSPKEIESYSNYLATFWSETCFIEISQDMIDEVASASYDTREGVLNCLAQYGLFVRAEKEDPQKMIQRLIVAGSSLRFQTVESSDEYKHRVKMSTLDKLVLESFIADDLKSPVYQYVSVNKLKLDLIRPKDESKPWLDMVSPFINIQMDQAKDIVYELCLETLSYFTATKEDLTKGCLSVLLTMLYAPNATLLDFLHTSDAKEASPSTPARKEVDALRSLLARHDLTPRDAVQKLAGLDFPFLLPLLQKPPTMDTIDISMYDLLRGDVPFDMGGLFTWQTFNKYGYNADDELPSLEDEALSTKDGVKCTFDYYYYLKAGRPTYALAKILLPICQKDESPRFGLLSHELSVYGLALSAWPEKRVTSACIALLLVGQLNYELLRTVLFVADLIIEGLEQQVAPTETQENLRKSQLNFLTQEVKGLLFRLNVLSSREETSIKLLSLLEDSILARVSKTPLELGESTGGFFGNQASVSKVDFSSKETLYLIFIGIKLGRDLASAFNLPQPRKILKFLADHDQWLVFLVCSQMFGFAARDVIETCASFKSRSLKEHLQFCLDICKQKVFKADLFVDKYEEEEDLKKSDGESDNEEPRWDSQSLTLKSRRRTKRKKIHKSQIKGENRSSSKIPWIGSSSLNTEKEVSEAPLNRSESVPFSRNKWEDCGNTTSLFSVVLKCHRMEKPGLELMDASVTFKSPILAVIGACYEPTRNMGFLAAWLLSYVPANILENNALKLCAPKSHEELLSHDYLESLLAFYLYYEHIDMVKEAFKVFSDQHLALPLFQALECAKQGADASEVSKILCSVYNDSLHQRVEEESETFIKEVSNLCVTTACQGIDLYLKNRSLQRTFMKALLPLCESFPFKSRAINWYQLRKILIILGSVRTSVNVFQGCFSCDNTRFDQVIRDLVNFLIEIENYAKALEVAGLLNLDTADIFCCQLESDFDLMLKTDQQGEESVKAFLLDSHVKMAEKKIPVHKVCLFFEAISNKSSDPYLSFLALQYSVVLSFALKPNENPEKMAKGGENWAIKSEQLELRMWAAYIQAKLHHTSRQLNFNLPECLESWPWEYGSKAMWLNHEDIERASGVFFETPKEEESLRARWRRIFPKVFRGKVEEAEDGIKQHMTSLIREALDNELLVTARRIEKLFGTENGDIDIMKQILKKACSPSSAIKLPHSSSNTVTSPVISHSESESGKSTPKKKVSSLSLKSGSFSHLSLRDTDITEWLADIYRLSSKLSVSYRFAKRIVMLSRIAEELSLSYLEIINHKDPTNLFVEVVSKAGPESLQLGRELIDAFPIPMKHINGLLFVEVVAVISAGPSPPPSESVPSSLLSWQTANKGWTELLSVTDTPSHIGHQLMDVFRSMSKETHPDRVAKAQTMSVEAIIRAHDCFSLAANMEGINRVLLACPSLTKALLKHTQWALMGRLLTGIGRYKELSYIIDLLRSHQQLERLLGRDSHHEGTQESSAGLDKALVHFLHANYPQDKEMLRMVALHFLMFSELAMMWEEEAEDIVKKVLGASLFVKPEEEPARSERPSRGLFFMRASDQEDSLSSSRDSSTSERKSRDGQIDYLKSPDVALLTEAIKCYCFASQYCIQEKQLMSAMRHSRQAELLAVQLSLVKSAPDGVALRVIKVPESTLSVIMRHHLSVPELIIVARAYGIAPDWASALYYRYIVQGDRKFLDHFLQFSSLTADLVISIVKKIEKGGLEPCHKDRMGPLLAPIRDVSAIYQIGSQLGLRERVEESLESHSACYLKDTVFSKGVTETT